MRFPVLVILLTFFVMGFGDMRGSLVGIAKEMFNITSSQGALIPFFGAAAFGVFALPAGILASRFGKKHLMVLGLLLTAAGHALPSLWLGSYSQLLGAIFLIGIGMTCLLVAGNPLLRDVTAPDRFARDLTFAQFIKSLGSICGPYLIALIVARGYAWQGVFPLFALFALATCLALVPARIPESIPLRPATLGAIFRLLKDRTILARILGIFLFVGSEMGLNTWLSVHLWLVHGMSIEVDAIRFGQGLFWAAQGVGRILGTILLTWVPARHFLFACALAGLGGLAGLMVGGRIVAVTAVALCGMSFANIWPTLFALLLESRPRQATELSGLTVMANAGGALLPALMGVIADRVAVTWCFLVPAATFLYLIVLAGAGLRRSPRLAKSLSR